jgi:hypothetical protein
MDLKFTSQGQAETASWQEMGPFRQSWLRTLIFRISSVPDAGLPGICLPGSVLAALLWS